MLPLMAQLPHLQGDRSDSRRRRLLAAMVVGGIVLTIPTVPARTPAGRGVRQ